MSKILNICFLGILFAFCFSFLRGGSAEDMFAIEKRELRSLPSLEEYELVDLPQAYNEYISDHFPLRRVIMKAASVGSYRLFDAIRSDAVVLGENRFLFLNSMNETSPKADYQGTNLFSDEELSNIVKHADELAQRAQDKGKKVVLMVVPNKEEVYEHYLPKSYTRVNDTTRRQQLFNRLAATELIVVDATDELEFFASADDDIYYKADTHWTGKGAYIGTGLLLDALGIEHVKYTDNSFVDGDYYESDIANLCNLYDEYTDTHDMVATENICKTPYEMKLSFVGDSFSWRMQEYLNESFSQTSFHDHYTSREVIAQEDADILVIEIVERNLGITDVLLQRYLY